MGKMNKMDLEIVGGRFEGGGAVFNRACRVEVIRILAGKVIRFAAMVISDGFSGGEKPSTELKQEQKNGNTRRYIMPYCYKMIHGLINLVDKKENSALHIATRKGRNEGCLAHILISFLAVFYHRRRKPQPDTSRAASVSLVTKEAEYAGLKEAEYAGLNQAKYDRLIPSEICIQAEYDICQAKYDRLIPSEI
ncbi:hypothetical protein Tco_0925967 [Tanacetum coccineum]|uniref:Uncharacterized protein n=1 Tax=Tanacetum coccineum TaxID=301880 RepID=A0ABQ5DB69_9ASTR